MLVKDFITKDIPVLKSFDTVEYALNLMDDWKLKHLPLVHETIYQSLVSEKDLLSLTDPSEPIGKSFLFAPAVQEDGPLHAALAMITRFGLCILPVVSSEGKYVGAITREKLLDALAELCNVHSEGSVIVLEMLPQDYVLSDIARLVESNNAHVLNLLTSTEKDTGRLLVTIKIDLEDASPVIRSFERFNYNVVYHFMENGRIDEQLQQRMNELLYYMNM
ncbi:CBS domain-containing protein [Parabacteroides sp. 52]|uniref:CBS domain-containing protein n=1 Tax=unclassified Parabacteroides TaxID=2649774 RepID=UPI0013D00122|nr:MULTISPECIES: CBS domain-containing protein [unclassified Parabacteroides]MDH6534262.1 acetoin utilization protein AcuB [Parabacteroides sp. PM5-20]NDV55354.1 CBS domain-containing protein [Parabacteroides sp. 52]